MPEGERDREGVWDTVEEREAVWEREVVPQPELDWEAEPE